MLDYKKIFELKTLEQQIKEPIIKELVVICEQQAQEFFDRYGQLINSGELQAITRELHKLKSSFGNLGLDGSYNIAANLEHQFEIYSKDLNHTPDTKLMVDQLHLLEKNISNDLIDLKDYIEKFKI